MVDESTTRRDFLKFLGGGGTLGVGFLYFSTRPKVVEQTADGRLSGETEILVRVANEGAKGGVRVSVNIVDSNSQVIKKSNKEVTMDRNQTVQVALSITVPNNADAFNVSATATNFPGNILF
ncbi:twin-arginine translocation signal domain-containing protein [Haloarcula amylovorans]|uniref:twin-arginine translocation signal domain-containing protein n=1 Tax=Haloarcula amylovorans TaxID=2562280 RepID=UPI001075D747|nr:twin-arginine translocation signal domain-containing protein [Halomicroarcula amylolytica]